MDTPYIKPRHLKEGDTIGIVAPASSFDPDKFRAGIKVLRNIGFRVKYERSIFNRCWSMPGHDKQRARQINRMFKDDNVKAIFCAKAGIGSMDILPYLDKKAIKNNPKIFLGYSDITVLLLYLQKIANMVVFHGPVLSGEFYPGMDPYTLNHMLQLFGEPSQEISFSLPQLVPLKPGRASGVLTGGNITRIVESMNTPYKINTDGKILFIEDTRETAGDIHGYLKKLKRAKKFKKIKGVVFGRMVDCDEKDHDLKEIVDKFFSNYDFPVFFGFPSGHTEYRGGLHLTLPLGVNVTMDTETSRFSIDEPAVF
ncbi:MAG: LD-carboxypeptidase [Elusimicrobia bacterium]|nr:LD-carboxypeptidase [Elusimicrobiota bacterium]